MNEWNCLRVLVITGIVTVCKVFGMLGTAVVEVDPQPDRTEVPIGMDPGTGSPIGPTASDHVNGNVRNSMAMSFGLTPLEREFVTKI